MPPNQVIKHPADASASSHASTLTQFGQLAGVKQVARGGEEEREGEETQ